MEAANDTVPATVSLPNAGGEHALTTTKKRGKMSLLRVAMYMLRKSSDNNKPKPPASTWKKIFASMRLLHLHETTQQSPHLVTPVNGGNDDGAVKVSNHVEKLEDDLMESPDKSPSSSSSSSYKGDSRFASAMDLQELDKNGEIENESVDYDDEKFDDSRGDAMIDEKAELFIANFYEEMRIQHEEMMNRQHQRKMSRS